MTARKPRPAPRCGRRASYVLTEAGLAATGGTTTPAEAPVPYEITERGRAALAADPAGDLRHEPRAGHRPCDGRGCRCTFPGPKNGRST